MAKKLSDREKTAQKAGVAVDYSKSAKQQVKPIAPVKFSLPKSLASKTPQAKLMQAQKSQPMYKPLKPGFQGPEYKKPEDTSRVSFGNGESVKSKNIVSYEDAVNPSSSYNQKLKKTNFKTNLSKAQEEAEKSKKEAEQSKKESGVFNTLKEFVTPTRGFSEKQIKEAKPSWRDAGKGVSKSVGEVANIIPTVGGLFAKGVASIAGKFGAKKYASNVGKGVDIYQQKTQDILKPKTAGEAKVMRGGDIAQFALPIGKAGAVTKETGRVINNAVQKGVSSTGINKIIKAGQNGVFENLGKSITANASLRAGSNLGPKTARAAEETPNLYKQSDNTLPKTGEQFKKNVDDFANKVDDAGTSQKTVGKLANNASPRKGLLQIAREKRIEAMKAADESGDIPKNIPRSRETLPKRNINKANQLFEDIDETSGKQKIFANVEDGSGNLKKVEVGEFDETGQFKERIHEDGRKISDVLDEDARNLKAGKRGVTKLGNPGDARAAMKQMEKPRKQGLLVSARQKLMQGKKSGTQESKKGLLQKLREAKLKEKAYVDSRDENIMLAIEEALPKIRKHNPNRVDLGRMDDADRLENIFQKLSSRQRVTDSERQSAMETLQRLGVGTRSHYAGAAAGLETDENGNLQIDPMKAGLGVLGMKAAGSGKGLLREARAKKLAEQGLKVGESAKVGAGSTVKSGFNSESYVKEMVRKQKVAESGPRGFLVKTKSFLDELKRKVVDTNAPIEDLVAEQQKKLNFEAIPRYDMTDAIDRVYRSTSMAGNFAKENGIEKVIKEVDNLDEFDQYLIAKHGLSLEKEGITTGRDAVKDTMLVEALGGKYAEAEKAVRNYSHKLLDYAVDSGLISKQMAGELKTKYPDYVPYNRIFGEDEAVVKGTGGGVANLGKQSVVQGIKGSERQVQSPMRSFLEKTTTAFQQGEKNKAAQILTSYHNLPDNPFGLEKVVGIKSPGDNTISVFKDGVKETWKTTKEIADAAKALNVEQIGILGKIFTAPVRVAKLGITGINLPFVAANVSRDIVSAAINSKHPLRSLLAMPQALFEAIGHGKLYKEMVGEGAMQTSFDIARNQIAPTVRNTRGLLGNKGIEKVKYVASTPGKLFRAVEDIIGRSEELNRISQYKGAYEGALAKGMKPVDARIVAARAARENSVNFSRKGEYGPAMNALVLYLNAGIQGSRTLLGNIKTRPVATSAKIVTVVGMPLAITTAWNLSDPKRKEAYEDIPEFEKENNFIFIPNNPTKDADGKWNVTKIPIQPGLSNLVQPIRYALERANGLDEQTFAQIASQLSGSVSPVQVPLDAETGRKTVSQFLPQALKPTAEAVTNTDLFTGGKIIPMGLQQLSPEYQVKDNTSGTAMALGKKLGVSPLHIEHFVKSTFGSVGLQVLNASDKALAATGKISPDDIGGQEVFQAITARFNKAAGGVKENKEYELEASQKRAHADGNAIAKAKLKKEGGVQMSGKTAFYLEDGEIKDFQADDIYEAEAKVKAKESYSKIQQLYKEGKDAEADDIINNLSDDDVENLQNVMTVEKSKATKEGKEKFKPTFENIRRLYQEGNDAEADAIVNSLSDEEIRYLELLIGK